MTLRDFFAGCALAGLLARRESTEVSVREAYLVADKLLEANPRPERRRRPTPKPPSTPVKPAKVT